MKLNNKGMTLVELLISVALLSVVLGFLFKVLLDVKYESDDAGFAIKNQINRAEIIKEIQNDVLDANGVNDLIVNNTNKQITISFGDGTNKIVNISNDLKTLSYDGKKWTIKDENYSFGNIVGPEQINDCHIMVTIPIVYLEPDNSIDDIEIMVAKNDCF